VCHPEEILHYRSGQAPDLACILPYEPCIKRMVKIVTDDFVFAKKQLRGIEAVYTCGEPSLALAAGVCSSMS